MTIPEAQTINLKVLELAQGEKGPKVSLEVPWSKYPMAVNVPSGHPLASKLVPGTVWAWTLKRGNMRKGQDGSTPDGSKEYHYWWNFGTVTEANAQPAPPAAPAPQSPPAPATEPAKRVQTVDDRTLAMLASYRKDLAIGCLQQAVVYHDRLLDGDGKRPGWDHVIGAAVLAYERFAGVCDMTPPEPEGPEPSAPDDQEF